MFFSIIITILIIFIIIIRLKERGNLGLEHRDGRKNKSIGDQPSSREDRGNPTPTPHGRPESREAVNIRDGTSETAEPVVQRKL